MKRNPSEIFLKSEYVQKIIRNITKYVIFSTIYVGKFPNWKGDKWCDDENNNCGCEWDGGDCCGEDNKYDPKYCTECACKDPAAKA